MYSNVDIIYVDVCWNLAQDVRPLDHVTVRKGSRRLHTYKNVSGCSLRRIAALPWSFYEPDTRYCQQSHQVYHFRTSKPLGR